jgi:hypothetical protein
MWWHFQTKVLNFFCSGRSSMQVDTVIVVIVLVIIIVVVVVVIAIITTTILLLLLLLICFGSIGSSNK